MSGFSWCKTVTAPLIYMRVRDMSSRYIPGNFYQQQFYPLDVLIASVYEGNMTLGEWMSKHGYSDERMAKLAGVSGATINRLRRGVNKPTSQTLAKLGEVTNGAVNITSFFPARRNRVA